FPTLKIAVLPLAALSLSALLIGCGVSRSNGNPALKPLVFVAIGASDAVGIGASDPAKTGWVPRLYQMLPAGTRLINLGISGATVQDAIDSELPVAIDTDPDLIVVWLAVNDIRAEVPLDTYDQNLDALLRNLTTKTKAKIVVANVPALTALPA